MANRVTQVAVEVLVQASRSARVTQDAVEVLVQGAPNARITQDAVEVLAQANPNVRVTQLATEALVTSVGNARVTQAGLDVLIQVNPGAIITQAGLETIFAANPNAIITQAGLETVMLVTDSNAIITQAGLEIVFPSRIRAIPCIAALTLRFSRSIPAQAAFSTKTQRSIPATSSLSQAKNRPIPASACFKNVSTRSVPAHARLGANVFSRSIPAHARFSGKLSRSVPGHARIGSTDRTLPAHAAFLNTGVRGVPAFAEIGYRRNILAHAVFSGTPRRTVPAFAVFRTVGRIPARASFWQNVPSFDIWSDTQAKTISTASKLLGGSVSHYQGWPQSSEGAPPLNWDQPYPIYDDTFWQVPVTLPDYFVPFPAVDPRVLRMDFNWFWPNPTGDYAENDGAFGTYPTCDPWNDIVLFRRTFGLPNDQNIVNAISGSVVAAGEGTLISRVMYVKLNGIDLPFDHYQISNPALVSGVWNIPSAALRPGNNVFAFAISSFISVTTQARSGQFLLTFNYHPPGVGLPQITG